MTDFHKTNGSSNGEQDKKTTSPSGPHAKPVGQAEPYAWICTECQQEVAERDKRCPHCGALFTYLKL